MSVTKGLAAATITALAVLCGVRAAMAEEGGSFKALSSLDARYAAIQHVDGLIVGSLTEGTVTVLESSGGLFVAGAHSNLACVVYRKISAEGL